MLLFPDIDGPDKITLQGRVNLNAAASSVFSIRGSDHFLFVMGGFEDESSSSACLRSTCFLLGAFFSDIMHRAQTWKVKR